MSAQTDNLAPARQPSTPATPSGAEIVRGLEAEAERIRARRLGDSRGTFPADHASAPAQDILRTRKDRP